MFSDPYVKKNISIAWPLALNALLMQSMLMIDTLLVSPLGEVSLAAMGIAGAIVAFMLGIQMALANGTQLVLSRAVGSGDPQVLNKGFLSGAIINVSSAVIFWLVLTLFDDAIISKLSSNIELQEQILSYLVITKYLVLCNAITQVMIALFNSLSRTKVPFKGYLIEMPFNAISSYFLIHGFTLGSISFEGMGLQGAALGSTVAIVLRMLYLTLCLHYETRIKLNLLPHLPHLKNNLKQHFLEIFPIAANITILSIGFSIYQLLYSQLDLSAYVAITLIFPWIRSGAQFITAWAHATAISISQAIGARKLDTMIKDVDTSIDITVWISIATSGFFFIVSLVISHIYPDLDPSTYEALAIIAPLYIFLPIIRGYNTVHGHALRAMGKTTAVFKINFTGQWVVSIPLCALLILGFDCSIFWAFAIQPFEEIIKALPFRYLARKTLKAFDSEQAEKLMYT